MTRILLFLLFFVLLAGETLGLDMSLAPGLSVKNAFLYMLLLGIAIDTALNRNRRIEAPSVIVPYLLCISYAIFTWLVVVLILDYSGYSAMGSLIMLKGGLADHLIVFLVFFYGVLNVKDALWLIKAMLWLVIIGNLLTVVDALNMPDLGLLHERESGRVGGPIGESNQYAVFLTLFLPGALALAAVSRGWTRRLAIGGACVSALALLMTVSRGGIVGLVIGGLLAAIFLRRFVPTRTIIYAVFIGIAFLTIGLLLAYAAGYGELLYDRFVGRSTGSAWEASSGRTVIWGRALEKMMDTPITLVTGYGWNSYRYFPDFGYAPHNSYLGIYFNLGVIGLALVLFSFWNVLRIAKRAIAIAPLDLSPLLVAFIFGFLGMLVGIFFVELYSPWLFIWAYTGANMRLAVSIMENKTILSGDSLEATALAPERPELRLSRQT